MSSPGKTLREVLEAGTRYLEKRNTENPKLACELLAARLLSCKRLELYNLLDEILGESKLEAMRRGIKRVAANEPVQYVTGEAQFHAHIFKVDSRALIPRPETETLVDVVLKTTDIWNKDRPVIADVGTGSGCIAITLSLAHPEAFFIALDTSAEALELARENASRLKAGQNIEFVEGELCDSVEPQSLDVVVANLPYIPVDDYEKLPPHIRNFEPRAALDGGSDGLSIINAVIQDVTCALKDNGRLFLEIGYQQASHVSKLLKELGFKHVEIQQDLAGKDRIAMAVFPPVE